MICVAHIIFRFAFSCGVCSVSLVRFPPVPVKTVPGVYQSAPSAVQVFLAVSSVYLYFVLWFHSALVSSFFFFFLLLLFPSGFVHGCGEPDPGFCFKNLLPCRVFYLPACTFVSYYLRKLGILSIKYFLGEPGFESAHIQNK